MLFSVSDLNVESNKTSFSSYQLLRASFKNQHNFPLSLTFLKRTYPSFISRLFLVGDQDCAHQSRTVQKGKKEFLIKSCLSHKIIYGN